MDRSERVSVDVVVCIDGDCAINYMVAGDRIEIEFGRASGSLTLCLPEDTAIKLIDIVSLAIEDFRQQRAA